MTPPRALVAVIALLGATRVAGVAPDGASCPASGVVALLASPLAPVAGGRLGVLAVADHPLAVTLSIVGPDGALLGRTGERRGGPPFWWYVEVRAPQPGLYRAVVDDGAAVGACQEVRAGASSPPRRGAGGALWAVAREWDRAAENLFAAWVEQLFDAPLGEEPSWRSLHEVTRDPARNLLHDHLGIGEDGEQGLRLRPDCADLPYFLRAYFAWKLGLPFGFSACSRGGGGEPPRCVAWHSNLEPAPPGTGGELAAMQRFFARRLAWGVQSGAGRTPAESDRTDLYPTRLAVETLRPGTVYADPYGHTLIVVRRVDQTPSSGGLLLAVDAQPDGTVARRRYWRGNFLFAVDPSLGSAGFKRFRPIVRDGAALRPLANREIAAHSHWGDYSLEQYETDAGGFYDRVDAVLSPAPQDPLRAFREVIVALDEQVHARVRSVANGEAWTTAHPGTIAMPDGAAIFETTGAWEDFATPARDLRLLIAIDVVRGFPDAVLRRPERFAFPAEKSAAAVRAELEQVLAEELRSRRFEYTRSDGSPWVLTLGDVLARAEALEVAYDPNDCVEIRWGALPDSEERSTCTRRAPSDHAARMAAHRAWFRERRRPPR